MKLTIVFLSLLLAGCATASKPTVYQVGDITVRTYPDARSLANDLPPVLRAMPQAVRVLGYYDRETRTIYSIDDREVLEHEFKHAREPEWTHSVGCVELWGSGC